MIKAIVSVILTSSVFVGMLFYNMGQIPIENNDYFLVAEQGLCNETAEITVLDDLDCVEDTNVALLATVTRSPTCTGTFLYFFNWKKDGTDVRNFLADFGVLEDQITQTEPGGDPLTAGLYEVTITESWEGTTPSFSDTFLLEVQDITAPVISCPSNITVSTDSGICGATVSFPNATATDDCSFSISQSSGLPSGSVFPVGSTSIEFTATDGAGNSSSCSFLVTVQDNEDPVINCPSNINASTDPGTCDAVVSFSTPSFSDNCTATIAQTGGLPSGSTFPVGATTIEFTATDSAGNTEICSFEVIVSDDEDPTITCPADQEVLPDSGDNYILPDYVALGDVTASDNCTTPVTDISQDPVAGTALPVGIYTISFTATDDAGNSESCNFVLSVIDDLGIVSADKLNQVKVLSPFGASLNLQIPEGLTINSIRLYSINGQIVQSFQPLSSGSNWIFNTDSIVNGLYFLEIDSGEGRKVLKLFK